MELKRLVERTGDGVNFTREESKEVIDLLEGHRGVGRDICRKKLGKYADLKLATIISRTSSEGEESDEDKARIHLGLIIGISIGMILEDLPDAEDKETSIEKLIDEIERNL